MFDENIHYYSPIFFGCHLPCCNVRDAVECEEVDGLTRSYLSGWDVTKRCFLSPIQGTGLSSVLGYDHNPSTSLITNVSTEEDGSEDSRETVPGSVHDNGLVFLRNLSSGGESTDASGDFWSLRNPVNSMSAEGVNDDVNEAVLKLTEYPFCCPGDFKRDISNADNVAEGCQCVDCICLVTTEVEDDDYYNYYKYNTTTDEGYYIDGKVHFSVI